MYKKLISGFKMITVGTKVKNQICFLKLIITRLAVQGMQWALKQEYLNKIIRYGMNSNAHHPKYLEKIIPSIF